MEGGGGRKIPPQIPSFPPTPPNIGRDDSLSPIEKPHLKIDYTIKMAAGGETGRPGVLAEGAPQMGTTPQKNPPLGGNRQDPREVGRQRNGFSGERRTKVTFLPGQSWLKKDKLSERKAGEVEISIPRV